MDAQLLSFKSLCLMGCTQYSCVSTKDLTEYVMSKSEASCLDTEWVPQARGKGEGEGAQGGCEVSGAQDQGIQGAREDLISTR